MHSFQPSRGRIVFDVLCALGIVASCIGAWKQTGASALLLAASIAGLYAFVRLFDVVRRNPAALDKPQQIEFESEVHGDVAASQAVDVSEAAIEPQPNIQEPEVSEPSAPRTGSGRRKGGSRKSSGRRAAPPKAGKVVSLAAPEEVKAVEPAPAEQAFEGFADEVAQSPVTPLFEPEPYLRMPRPAFGRKAG